MNQDRADLLLGIISYVTRNGFSQFDAVTIAAEIGWSEQDTQTGIDDLITDGYIAPSSTGTYDIQDAPRERAQAEILQWLVSRL